MDTLLKVFSVQEILALDAPSLSTPAQKRTRDGFRRTEAGRVDKAQAPWQKMLDGARTGQNNIADARSRDGMYFRRRFRMPYSLFTGLVQVMLDENWFPKIGKNGSGPVDASGRVGASLHVKVLSALRVIGRGVCFDECFDGSGCGEESIRIFFHDFTAIFAERYQLCILTGPKTPAEVDTQLAIYGRLGLPGAVASTDCTHIPLGKVSNKFKVLCTGKEGFPTMVYSVTCSHSRKIYYCSSGFYGTCNDKTISRADAFITAVGSHPLFTDHEFEVKTSESTSKTLKGVYILCDGGYHKWRHLLCGLKNTSSAAHSLWSCQMESARKDIECVFGILKCRFQILHKPIQYMDKTWEKYRSKVDNIMYCCCILHNMLLRIDGLEFLWTDKDVLSWHLEVSC